MVKSSKFILVALILLVVVVMIYGEKPDEEQVLLDYGFIEQTMITRVVDAMFVNRDLILTSFSGYTVGETVDIKLGDTLVEAKLIDVKPFVGGWSKGYFDVRANAFSSITYAIDELTFKELSYE